MAETPKDISDYLSKALAASNIGRGLPTLGEHGRDFMGIRPAVSPEKNEKVEPVTEGDEGTRNEAQKILEL